MSCSRGPCNYYDDNDYSQREKSKAKKGGQGDYHDRSRYYKSVCVCVIVCVTIITTTRRRKRD